jgi:protein phosphatase
MGACTDKGQVRTLNEDFYACKPDLGLFIVCDGMGGEAAGEVASQLAGETILRQLDGTETWAQGKPTAVDRGFQAATRRIESAIRLANQAIHKEAQKDSERKGMGTTVVCAWIRDNLASLAHVGDSRAYLWRHQSFEQVTSDHSLVEEQVRAGLMTREESRQAENQNVLLRALDGKAEVEVDLAELPLLPGDYLLLCSDGLSTMVDDPTMADTITRLREPQKICDSLVELANRNGGEDNITVVIIQAREESWWQRFRSMFSR